MDNQKTKNQEAEEKVLSWQAPEYQEYQKHPLWFVGFGIVAALLVLYGILSNSWTTTIVFALLGVMGLVFAAQKPRQVVIRLTPTHIQINNLTYTYKVIKKFWIVYNPPEVKALYFETTAYLDRVMRLELADQDPVKIKAFLKRYLEEDLELEESTGDIIARKLRF